MISEKLRVSVSSEGDASLATDVARAVSPVDGAHIEELVELTGRADAGDAHRLDSVISAIDATTLDGTDTPTRVRDLVASALRPDPEDETAPHTAAVCVYPDMVPVARRALGASSAVRLASVAGAFPSGRSPLEVRVAEVAYALERGADEIDMVIDRGAFLSGEFAKVSSDIVAMKALCRVHGATLKVILENCDLGGPDGVARASWIAMAAGADFIKTSTGKGRGSATLQDVAVMLLAARDYEEATGRRVGVKAAGGIRDVTEALHYLRLAERIGGTDASSPTRFRFGASSLLGAAVAARRRSRA